MIYDDTSFFTDNRNVTFSLVDVTRTSGMDEWIRGDPFSQTRVGNETNPFIENVDVAVQEVYDDELGLSDTSNTLQTPKKQYTSL